jgi:hypothetical protein
MLSKLKNFILGFSTDILGTEIASIVLIEEGRLSLKI